MKKSVKYKKAEKKVAPKKTAPRRIPKKAAKRAVKKAARKRIRGNVLATRPQKKRNLASKNKPKVYSDALIDNAKFLHDNVLLLSFSDGHQQTVDFYDFLNAKSTPPYIKRYRAERKFKSFKVENGNLVWGKDWDLMFPIKQLYTGRIN